MDDVSAGLARSFSGIVIVTKPDGARLNSVGKNEDALTWFLLRKG